jgi:hypothetical protein
MTVCVFAAPRAHRFGARLEPEHRVGGIRLPAADGATRERDKPALDCRAEAAKRSLLHLVGDDPDQQVADGGRVPGSVTHVCFRCCVPRLAESQVLGESAPSVVVMFVCNDVR